MSITFTCTWCNRSFTVDEKLAGKRGKCKSCGSQMKIPELVTSTGGLNLEDLYGVEDAPAVSAGELPARVRGSAADSAPERLGPKLTTNGGESVRKAAAATVHGESRFGGPVVPS